jgi:hypothetical protein
MTTILFVFINSLILALVLTPLAGKLGERFGDWMNRVNARYTQALFPGVAAWQLLRPSFLHWLLHWLSVP